MGFADEFFAKPISQIVLEIFVLSNIDTSFKRRNKNKNAPHKVKCAYCVQTQPAEMIRLNYLIQFSGFGITLNCIGLTMKNIG